MIFLKKYKWLMGFESFLFTESFRGFVLGLCKCFPP